MNIADIWVLEADEEYSSHDNKHDKGYKYLLSVKKVFVQLLKSFVNQGWVSKIEADDVEKIDKSFILKDFREKEADLVYKVKLDDKEVFFYILLELQSTVDFQMPYRLLQYMMEIWRTILIDTDKNTPKRKDFKLPVIVPCVLYNGKDNWTVLRSFRETLEENEIFQEYILDFKYILIDVNRYSKEDLLKLSNLIAAVFFIDQSSDYEEIYERIKILIEQLSDISPEELCLFITWMKNIILRGFPKEKIEEIEKIFNESKEDASMVYAVEEAIKKEILRYEKMGIEKGIEKGKTEVILKASKRGLTIEAISDLTDMDICEVEKIISDHKQSS